ncbi:MAG: hypothetical protein M9894_16200 [Planctomycetes bacterium]|nr:hypothetical protein [Planctomycetota bacterium]
MKHETRSIYVVADSDGNTVGAAWAHAANEALAALKAPAGASAHRTAWRRMPDLLCGDAGRQHGAKIAGNAIEVGGLRFVLEDQGRPMPGSTARDPMEPQAPDVEVVDEEAALELAEVVGPLHLTERLSLRPVVVDARPARERPATPAGARVIGPEARA